MTERHTAPISMDELADAALPLVTAYGGGGFTIGGKRWETPILVRREGVEPLAISGIADLSPTDLVPLLGKRGAIDLLLVGGGERLVQPSAALRKALREAGIGVEAMDSGAAARTFNVLLLEARRVAAVLVPL
ncbi:MAG: hypothetical protein D6807_06375 [Alphaproteobacteria bacterium]|nr:MAG: hypothetical protein D6807_06375 [Alphaproteobacteria bacterium]